MLKAVKKSKFSDEVDLEIISLYNNGASTNVLGRMYNCSNATIFRILKRNNIPTRTLSQSLSLRWDNPDCREQFINAKKGRPSGATGKTWQMPDRYKIRPKVAGDKNPNWKGGKSKISISIRGLPEYKDWRKSIFERDNHTCVLCGDKTEKGKKVILNADHIYPLSKILHDFNIATIDEARKCQSLWDLENGRTLCEDCHKKTETWGLNQFSHPRIKSA